MAEHNRMTKQRRGLKAAARFAAGVVLVGVTIFYVSATLEGVAFDRRIAMVGGMHASRIEIGMPTNYPFVPVRNRFTRVSVLAPESPQEAAVRQAVEDSLDSEERISDEELTESFGRLEQLRHERVFDDAAFADVLAGVDRFIIGGGRLRLNVVERQLTDSQRAALRSRLREAWFEVEW